ncbi:rRNA biogenesis protein rrp5 [Agyrium rufum]|nr:rRNA biogenesis protein rrp5 [Agyrium rufum]
MPLTKRKAWAAVVEEDQRPSKKAKKPPADRNPKSLLSQEEAAFPRGGASVLTPLEHKQIRIQAERDVLFEQIGPKSSRDVDSANEEEQEKEVQRNKSADRRTGTKKTNRKEKTEKSQQILKVDDGPRIEGLSYKRLVPGSLVLGMVQRINKYDVELSLPNNLTGYIPITSLSDGISKHIQYLLEESDEKPSKTIEDEDDDNEINIHNYFSEQQYLRAYVVATTNEKGRRHIELSVNPRQANIGMRLEDIAVHGMIQAAVRSVEDHGIIMDLGLEDTSVRGFMSSKDFDKDKTFRTTRIKEGSVYLCIVTGKNSNGNIVKLSKDPEQIGKIKKGNLLLDAPTIDSYLPGTAVEILISQSSENGLAGKVMGLIDVTADIIHSGSASNTIPLDKLYPVGSKTTGRIICTFPSSEKKKLGVSLLPHVLSYQERSLPNAQNPATRPLDLLPLSTVIEEVRVLRVEPGVGIFVGFGIKGLWGFVHISQLSDTHVQTISPSTGQYKLDTVHRGRVIGYNSVDGVFLVSLQQSIIDMPFLRLGDINLGQEVNGTIKKLLIGVDGVSGLIVKLTDSISGLVPSLHFSDIHLQHPEQRFKEGQAIKARVLQVLPETGQLRLTMKKSLVNFTGPIWSSIHDLETQFKENILPTEKIPGTLINIHPSGAVVQFYDRLRAFLPAAEMSETFIKSPKDFFSSGQIVHVRIIAINAAAGRLLVSCRDSSSLRSSNENLPELIRAGSVTDGIVREKTKDEMVIDMGGRMPKALLPTFHLTDGSTQKCASASKKIRISQTLKDLVVLKVDNAKNLISLTNKPSIVDAVKLGVFPCQLNDVVIGTEVAGFVKNITSAGVFVEFGNGLTGLLPKNQLDEASRLLPDFGFHRQQSLKSIVLSVNLAQDRFTLTKIPKNLMKDNTSIGKVTFLAKQDKLENTADSSLSTINELTLGRRTAAIIRSVKDTQLNVILADGIRGRVDISEAFDDWADIQDHKRPLGSFKAKDVIQVRIMGLHDSRNHRFLPITNTNKSPVFELTAKPSALDLEELEILTLDEVKEGSSWIVFVNNVGEDCLWVNVSPNVRGRIRAIDASDDASLLSDLAKNFPIGSALRAHVIGVDLSNNRLDLSARSGQSTMPTSLKELSVGDLYAGRVTKVADGFIMVQINEHLSAPVYLIDMADDFDEANPSAFHKNQIVRVCVQTIDEPNKRFTLSSRPSKILSSSLPVKDPEITTISQLKLGHAVRGFIKNIADSGLFITIASKIAAYVRVSDLSDSYLKDWKADFELDQLVTGKIIALDVSTNQIQLSLKDSVLDPNYKPQISLNTLRVGQIVTGKVRKIEEFGVFIVLDHSVNVSGLCHRSEIAEKRPSDVTKLFSHGDPVKAKVLSIDLEKRRIAFGLKASYFKEDEEDSSVSSDSADDIDFVEQGVDLNLQNGFGDDHARQGPIALAKARDSDSEEDLASNNVNSARPTVQLQHTPRVEPLKSLSAGGFDWTGGIGDKAAWEEDSDSDGEEDKPKKKRRRPDTKEDRTGDLDTKGPQSPADFERMLLGEPVSSYLWLNYMAFHVELGDITKAQEIAERALRIMNSIGGVEHELTNIWTALMNLENTYGTQDSLAEVFMRACEVNDPEDMHKRLISIYIQSSKNEQAGKLLQALVKKHSANPKNWLNAFTFFMSTLSAPERARTMLSRALQALPSYTHVDLTSKFAQLEFRNGDPERGRTLFEGLLGTWPKRTDLWNVLLDAEIKLGDKEIIRGLFKRVTQMGLKPKQAKFFFKRWLDWEDKEGDKKSQERVKLQAEEYVRQQKQEGVAQTKNI